MLSKTLTSLLRQQAVHLKEVMQTLIICLSCHNLKLIGRIVPSLDVSIQLLDTFILNSCSDTNILSEDSIQSQYSKLDVDSMVEFAHKQINATSSGREKEKY